MLDVRKTEEFRAWFLSLRDRCARAQVGKRLDRLERSHLGDVKPVGHGVLELRVLFGPGYRVYLTRRGDLVVILLCGGDKGSQRRDIARAKELAREIGYG